MTRSWFSSPRWRSATSAKTQPRPSSSCGSSPSSVQAGRRPPRPLSRASERPSRRRSGASPTSASSPRKSRTCFHALAQGGNTPLMSEGHPFRCADGAKVRPPARHLVPPYLRQATELQARAVRSAAGASGCHGRPQRGDCRVSGARSLRARMPPPEPGVKPRSRPAPARASSSG